MQGYFLFCQRAARISRILQVLIPSLSDFYFFSQLTSYFQIPYPLFCRKWGFLNQLINYSSLEVIQSNYLQQFDLVGPRYLALKLFYPGSSSLYDKARQLGWEGRCLRNPQAPSLFPHFNIRNFPIYSLNVNIYSLRKLLFIL